MKIELNENGFLTITAETKTEGYALKKWIEENKVEMKKLIFYHGNTNLSKGDKKQ